MNLYIDTSSTSSTVGAIAFKSPSYNWTRLTAMQSNAARAIDDDTIRYVWWVLGGSYYLDEDSMPIPVISSVRGGEIVANHQPTVYLRQSGSKAKLVIQIQDTPPPNNSHEICFPWEYVKGLRPAVVLAKDQLDGETEMWRWVWSDDINSVTFSSLLDPSITMTLTWFQLIALSYTLYAEENDFITGDDIAENLEEGYRSLAIDFCELFAVERNGVTVYARSSFEHWKLTCCKDISKTYWINTRIGTLDEGALSTKRPLFKWGWEKMTKFQSQLALEIDDNTTRLAWWLAGGAYSLNLVVLGQKPTPAFSFSSSQQSTRVPDISLEMSGSPFDSDALARISYKGCGKNQEMVLELPWKNLLSMAIYMNFDKNSYGKNPKYPNMLKALYVGEKMPYSGAPESFSKPVVPKIVPKDRRNLEDSFLLLSPAQLEVFRQLFYASNNINADLVPIKTAGEMLNATEQDVRQLIDDGALFSYVDECGVADIPIHAIEDARLFVAEQLSL